MRTAEDLSVIVGVPVIATVSRPKSRRDPRRTRRYTGTFAGFTRTLGNSAGAQGK